MTVAQGLHSGLCCYRNMSTTFSGFIGRFLEGKSHPSIRYRHLHPDMTLLISNFRVVSTTMPTVGLHNVSTTLLTSPQSNSRLVRQSLSNSLRSANLSGYSSVRESVETDPPVQNSSDTSFYLLLTGDFSSITALLHPHTFVWHRNGAQKNASPPSHHL